VPAPSDAFDLLMHVQAAASREALAEVLQSCARHAGLSAGCIVQFAMREGEDRVFLLAGNPPAVLAHLVESQPSGDPMAQRLRSLLGPARWVGAVDVSPAGPDRLMARHGQVDGLVVPVRLPDGGRGAVVFLGITSPGAEPDAVALVILGLAAAAQLAHLAPETGKGPLLTAREREVLQWTAAGKTADASASILGISVRTVEYHLLNAARKLNTANRTQTVVEALRSRQISL